MVFVPFILNVRLAANDAPAPIYLYRIVTLHTHLDLHLSQKDNCRLDKHTVLVSLLTS